MHNAPVQREEEINVDALRYEIRDVKVSGLVMAVVVLFLLGLGAALAMWWFLAALMAGDNAPTLPASLASEPIPAPMGARLQQKPVKELSEFLEPGKQQLTSYGWVNQEMGVVHIPIDVAIQKVATEGIAPKFMPLAPTEGASAPDVNASDVPLDAPTGEGSNVN